MAHSIFISRTTWLGIGLVAGVVLGAMAPHSPLHAVATDRTANFAMATGPVDQDTEAVFFLDFLTGDLRAVVLGRRGNAFTAFYTYNVLNDMGVNPAQNPSFMMCTGVANLPRGAQQAQPSRTVVYVAEVNTGVVAAYALPWSPAAHAAGQITRQPFQPQAVTRFRNPPGAPGP